MFYNSILHVPSHLSFPKMNSESIQIKETSNIINKIVDLTMIKSKQSPSLFQQITYQNTIRFIQYHYPVSYLLSIEYYQNEEDVISDIHDLLHHNLTNIDNVSAEMELLKQNKFIC
eukprot:NODE_368_length_8682_cov_0.309915.p8 type:complete len:116 gc:universal NODE_368_length_8682_cov_0.309915:4522-4869(+)